MIVTASHLFGSIDNLAQRIARQKGITLSDRMSAESVDAEINHGRWLASCPSCNGAELVDPQDPRFMCLSCFNADLRGEWRQVTFPPERPAIENALAERSRMETRNWQPGEFEADLLAQTLEREGR